VSIFLYELDNEADRVALLIANGYPVAVCVKVDSLDDRLDEQMAGTAKQLTGKC